VDSKYNFERMSILLVDNNVHMRTIVSTILNGFGVGKIIPASDSTLALKVLREKSIDLVICEYRLMPLNGLELSKAIRTGKDSPNPTIPVLMLTADSELEKVKIARDVGITEFMTKPISPVSLYKHIVNIVEHPRQFIRNKKFFGPDRRRRRGANFKGENRRADRDECPQKDSIKTAS